MDTREAVVLLRSDLTGKTFLKYIFLLYIYFFYGARAHFPLFLALFFLCSPLVCLTDVCCWKMKRILQIVICH